MSVVARSEAGISAPGCPLTGPTYQLVPKSEWPRAYPPFRVLLHARVNRLMRDIHERRMSSTKSSGSAGQERNQISGALRRLVPKVGDHSLFIHHPRPFNYDNHLKMGYTLLVDNYDSFTWNIYADIATLGGNPLVRRNDKITIADVQVSLSCASGHTASSFCF
jgi:hypothetical protein